MTDSREGPAPLVQVVLYGPALSGKSTTLRALHARLPAQGRTDVVIRGNQLAFACWPPEPVRVGKRTVRLGVRTVPGEWELTGPDEASLAHADGVIFVADSTPGRLEDNIRSFRRMERVLRRDGVEPLDFPLVLQLNKRDHPRALPTAVLQERLSRYRYEAPTFATSAERGEGVMLCLQVVAWLVAERLRRGATLRASR